MYRLITSHSSHQGSPKPGTACDYKPGGAQVTWHYLRLLPCGPFHPPCIAAISLAPSQENALDSLIAHRDSQKQAYWHRRFASKHWRRSAPRVPWRRCAGCPLHASAHAWGRHGGSASPLCALVTAPIVCCGDGDCTNCMLWRWLLHRLYAVGMVSAPFVCCGNGDCTDCMLWEW